MMALQSIIPFPIVAPLAPPSKATTNSGFATTEVRFSRWNNANAEEFNRHQRTQQQIEDDIRRHRRFQYALNIANIFNSDTPFPTKTSTATAPTPVQSNFVDRNPSFRSIGTPSTPSTPSIPGKKSKYSKTANYNPNRKPVSQVTHPAFRKLKTRPIPETGNLEQGGDAAQTVRVEDGVSYVVAGAPFEYMYSYTETPRVKPVALREPPIAPFGPCTMPRPWTGRKPLPPSKKNLPEFDSFVAPPNRKGVKPVQRPGPFLPGSGPKYVWSREEILGEPLTSEEVNELVEGCRKSKRQLNMGRDGFTHNMLDNIHAHWKRRRVCKIKCKGVCTVDMDTVCRQLEEKTGGKIIYRKGGVLYLFRGRNYNYKTRPRYPLMLWKPITPVYPRLIKHVPDGLTLEEATDMRNRGRELVPICKLAKNGVYIKLVESVREAFEACELVRIDCRGLNGSDYRKIGAKLKDLVPCVLISFENEHVLVWRGGDWKSSLSGPQESDMSNATSTGQGIIDSSTSKDQNVPLPCFENRETMGSCSEEVEMQRTSDGTSSASTALIDVEKIGISKNHKLSSDEDSESSPSDSINTNKTSIHGDKTTSTSGQSENESNIMPKVSGSVLDGVESSNAEESNPSTAGSLYLQGVELLLRQAVESGSALILDDAVLDADIIHEKSVAFAQIAPPGPVFRHQTTKVAVQKTEKQETNAGDVDVEQVVPVIEKRGKERMSAKTEKKKGFLGDYRGAAPQGSLGVDELAKLLA